MKSKQNSLDYAMRLASAASLLCGTVAELRAELGKNRCLLDSYVPMLMSRLGDEALGEMIGCKYPELGKTYLQHTRERLCRCGVGERLDLLDRLARECFCAMGMKTLA